MSKNKVSLVIAASNGLEFTMKAIASAKENTLNDNEIIVIDNFSSDGSDVWLNAQKGIKVIRTEKLETYSKAINMGLEAASKDSNYLAVLNNDLIFTKGWDEKLISAFGNPNLLGLDKIGIAGPMSNHVAGFQQIKHQNYNVNICHQYAEALEKDKIAEFKKTGRPLYMRSGFLSGFCWIMSRECYESVGKLDDLNAYKVNNIEMPLGFEDNDYVLRAELSGFASVIVRHAFVHHFGGQTTAILKQDFAKRGMMNRFPFYNKWKKINALPLEHKSKIEKIVHETVLIANDYGKLPENEVNEELLNKAIKYSEEEMDKIHPPLSDSSSYKEVKFHKKLVAGYRVKNVERWFDRVLTKMETIADEIIIFDDNSTDKTVEIAKKHQKVVEIYTQTEATFNEARDREILFQACKSRNPDWIIITDGDEEFEEKFDRKAAERLMNPVRPNVFAYIFRYITHWDSEDMQRTDGIFGNMANIRMIRNLPNQHIFSSHPQGFHCNSVPWTPIENVMITPYRIRHYGYIDADMRMKKYEWYESMDTDKRETAIGAADYSHLIDTNAKTIKYNPKITLGLTMIVKNESDNLEVFLDNYYNMFDEMIIVDTGSKDNSKWIAEYYGAKVYDYVWKDDFTDARNFAKSKCTSDWCFQLDPDERLSHGVGGDMFRFYRMIEEPVLAYIFPIINYLPSGKAFVSENSRLFRNLPEIYYTGEVHESVNEQLSKTKGYGKTIFFADAREALHHYGYLKHPLAVEKKLRRYVKINEKILSKNPNDGMAHFSLALHYLNDVKKDDKDDKDKKKNNENIYSMENEGKAEYHFIQAMIHSPKLTQSHNQLANLYMRKARRCLEDAISKTNPAHPIYQSSLVILNTIKPFCEELEVVGIPSATGVIPD